MSDLTVCICTYNRADLLGEALASLARARQPARDEWEVLVIDNNSDDHTRAVVESFGERLPVRWVRERQQGLSHARNRACGECHHDLLLFTDDDVRVDTEWIVAYRRAVGAFQAADYFGGRLLPDWRLGRPRWFRDENLAHLSGLIGKYDLGAVTRPLDADDPLPFGGSFGVRRRLFERHGPFRVDLGTVGRVPGRGEEAEYLARARAAGARGVYVADAISEHLVNPANLKVGYLYRFGIEKGVAARRIDGVEGGSVSRAAGHLLRGLLQLAKGRGDRFRQCVINMGIESGLRRERPMNLR